MDTTIKDCNNCVKHKQGEVPAECRDCLDITSNSFSENLRLPFFEPRKQTLRELLIQKMDQQLPAFADLSVLPVGAQADTKPTNPKDAIADSKPPLWLLSPIAKAHWALAQAVGMVKYGAWNWRVAGVRSSIYASGIQRHFDRWLSGEDYDPVDGQHHLGAIMAGCAILLDAQAAGKLTDDRPPSVGVKEVYEDIEARFKVAIKKAEEKGLKPVHHTIRDTQL